MLLLSGGRRDTGLLRSLVTAHKAIYREIIGLTSTKRPRTVIAALWPIWNELSLSVYMLISAGCHHNVVLDNPTLIWTMVSLVR